MKRTLLIVYILIFPIMPIFMAIREYRFIKVKNYIKPTPSFIKVLYVHYQAHTELIKYWDGYWEKEGLE